VASGGDERAASMSEAETGSGTVAVATAGNRHLDRQELLQELIRRYGGDSGFRLRLRFYRKKYAWLAVVAGAALLKRSVDIIAAAFFLVALSPLFAVVALIIKLTDGGPVLYRQTRVGRWGREFPFPKFRSMVMNSDKLRQELLKANDHGNGITFKMKRDPRITPIGRFIRKFSIDEIPQLWCVLKGDMSLVGPRPPIPSEVARYTLRDRRRLDVIPGLTCIWQVSGRSDIPFDRQVEMDIEYIESQSLWFDIVLLLRTVPAVLLGKGAY
jgi:lipopolysaccharide/colanic/teichoic acid biosynthesis glycosyltransferase